MTVGRVDENEGARFSLEERRSLAFSCVPSKTKQHNLPTQLA